MFYCKANICIYGLKKWSKNCKNKLKCRGTCIVLITNFLKYHGFISCLKNIEYSYIPRNIEKKLKSKKGTRDMHAILSNNHVQPINKQK
jgi:hypothetical protein